MTEAEIREDERQRIARYLKDEGWKIMQQEGRSGLVQGIIWSRNRILGYPASVDDYESQPSMPLAEYNPVGDD